MHAGGKKPRCKPSSGELAVRLPSNVKSPIVQNHAPHGRAWRLFHRPYFTVGLKGIKANPPRCTTDQKSSFGWKKERCPGGWTTTTGVGGESRQKACPLCAFFLAFCLTCTSLSSSCKPTKTLLWKGMGKHHLAKPSLRLVQKQPSTKPGIWIF